MKNLKNKKSVLIIALAVILIVVGMVLLLTGNTNSIFGNKENDNTNTEDGPINPGDELIDDNTDVDTNKLPLTKSDVISMVYQEKATSNNTEPWYVGDAVVVAHNSDNTIFLVRYKKVLSTGASEEVESIISLTDGEKKIEPAWQVGSKDVISYSFISYEGTEEFDPMNHQYTQENVGWDSSNTYTPDPEKGW